MSDLVWFNAIGMQDIPQVGGKIASLGEMINHLNQAGVKVPQGFATTAQAYRDFLQANGLGDKIKALLSDLDSQEVDQLAKTAKTIREWILAATFSPKLITAVTDAYHTLQSQSGSDLRVAVRSSATAEDLPHASFAGQQESFLNIYGLENVFQAIKQVFASLYNDRAISYRAHHKFLHEEVAISAGIQQMVRSDLAASGVMFSMDTESGFDKVIFITASYGLGEAIVQGDVNPDEYYVYKPNLALARPAILRRQRGKKDIKMIYAENKVGVSKVAVSEQDRLHFCLTNEEVEELARLAVAIESHYGRPMDIEWAKDGIDGDLFILQARPETVKSRCDDQTIERYRLSRRGQVIANGRSVGQKIGQGKAKIILKLAEMSQLKQGEVLVTDMTDPDWEPVMKRASAIITNRGGRTCHAAIIARELGIPAVVGCGDATLNVKNETDVTVSCAEGETGYIYQGLLPYEIQKISLDNMPNLPFSIMLNVGNPERAFDFQFLPNKGVGLARLEFIINNMIGIHPKALLQFENLPQALQETITPRISGYAGPVEYYVERLKEGIAMIAAAFYPKPVILRFSDFKSNEYANLIGGNIVEPQEDNPMIGFRGASRYLAESFRDCFELEIEAVKRARDLMGFDNLWLMIPFVRTINEAKQVIDLLETNGLKRGVNHLKIIMMCEIPSNALLADDFLQYFDGFSIGSNDLTQLTLGLDRDSGIVAALFDERDPAVKVLLQMAIEACKRAGKYIGICGQGPSDHPDLARWLADMGIQSISLNPDTVVDTWIKLGKDEKPTESVNGLNEMQLNLT